MRHLTVILLFTSIMSGFLRAQDDVVRPGDNLILDGVPDVPAALAEKLTKYSEFRSASMRSWHPTERKMIIGTRFGETSQLHLVDHPGGARQQLTFFNETARGGYFDPIAGKFFLLMRDIGGSENYQIFRYEMETGVTTLLTDGKSRNTGGLWSNKGDRIVYQSNRRNGNDMDIWVMDPRDPSSDRLAFEQEGGGWFVMDWSPDDTRLLVMNYISVNESYLWDFNLVTNTKTNLTPKGKDPVSYGGGAYTADGNGLLVSTDAGSEFQRLATLQIASGKMNFLTSHIHWDVDNFSISKNRNRVAFVTNEDGVHVLHTMELTSGKEIKLPSMPIGVMGGVDWRADNNEIAFTWGSPRTSYDVYSIDIKKSRIERWTFSETGGVQTERFTEPSLVKWKSFDDKTISGFLYRPAKQFAGKRPVVIDIHGGPEAQSQPSFIGRDNYYLNELGVAILFPNVRGSTGYGKTFMTLDNGFLREDSYKDIGALLDWIKTQPDLDADRVMITGGSYGGHMTLALSTLYSDRIKCSVAIVGMSNLVTFLENTSGYRRDLRRVEYGDERDPKMREYLLKIAPVNNAEKIKKPLFIIQGANDPRVPASEAEQMMATLKKIGTPAWLMIAKDEGHGFAKKSNRDYEFYSTILFMEKYLLN
ncbi:MAG: S9 family peptidase [Bacteroidetes bacterium]|nr:S9 family peptidase [Bacteroidota bacterium]